MPWNASWNVLNCQFCWNEQREKGWRKYAFSNRVCLPTLWERWRGTSNLVGFEALSCPSPCKAGSFNLEDQSWKPATSGCLSESLLAFFDLRCFILASSVKIPSSQQYFPEQDQFHHQPLQRLGWKFQRWRAVKSAGRTPRPAPIVPMTVPRPAPICVPLAGYWVKENEYSE